MNINEIYLRHKRIEINEMNQIDEEIKINDINGIHQGNIDK